MTGFLTGSRLVHYVPSLLDRWNFNIGGSTKYKVKIRVERICLSKQTVFPPVGSNIDKQTAKFYVKYVKDTFD